MTGDATSRTTRAWRAWVDLWDRREDAAALALVRIFVGLVLACDYLDLARLDLVDVVYSTRGFGLASDPHALWVIAVAASIAIALGFATPLACVAFLYASVQLGAASPNAERGIDTLLRIVAGILALSRCNARWSMDALVMRAIGRPLSREVPAWPRYLLLLQLLWVYFGGGLNKGGAPWFPHGGFTALSNILADPHVARFDPGWVSSVMPLTRVATAVTMLFEFGAPLYLLFYIKRWGRPRWAWIAVGVAFHLGIAIAMRLGAFPWGMLALYPVLLRPEELARFTRSRTRAGYRETPAAPPP